MTIDRFKGEYEFLSNFARTPFMATWYGASAPDPVLWPTMEHYFQAAKTFDWVGIRHAANPAEAKSLGRKAQLVNDWEEIKIDVMRTGLRCKFAAGSELAERLVATGDQELIEGNNWRDDVWGMVWRPNSFRRMEWQGQNLLGKLLMVRRLELQLGLT